MWNVSFLINLIPCLGGLVEGPEVSQLLIIIIMPVVNINGRTNFKHSAADPRRRYFLWVLIYSLVVSCVQTGPLLSCYVKLPEVVGFVTVDIPSKYIKLFGLFTEIAAVVVSWLTVWLLTLQDVPFQVCYV